MVEHLPSMREALGSIPGTTKKKTKGLAVFLLHGVRATSHSMPSGQAIEAGSGASSSKEACGTVRGYSDLFNPQHPVTSDKYIFP